MLPNAGGQQLDRKLLPALAESRKRFAGLT
jgi:hypothetical protein